MAPALSLREVSLAFGGVSAVNAVDLDLEAGECLALIGPNGSGKSTLINILSGLYRPDGGRVMLAGRDLTGAPPRALVKAGVARTFQNLRFFGRMNVRENLEAAFDALSSWHEAVYLSPQRRRERDGRIAAAAADFGLTERLEDAINRLSFFERRRLEIARAVLVPPSLLLLDEPAAGLAPAEVDQFVRLLHDKAVAGRSVLLVEHKAGVIGALAGRTVVMRAGTVMAEGPTGAMLADARVRRLWLGEAA